VNGLTGQAGGIFFILTLGRVTIGESRFTNEELHWLVVVCLWRKSEAVTIRNTALIGNSALEGEAFYQR
jgi:hypothetical protein